MDFAENRRVIEILRTQLRSLRARKAHKRRQLHVVLARLILAQSPEAPARQSDAIAREYLELYSRFVDLEGDIVHVQAMLEHHLDLGQDIAREIREFSEVN